MCNVSLWKALLSVSLALLFITSVQAQSGAVIKGGLIVADIERDGKSILAQSATGYMAGFDIRLMAEERTYLKPSVYLARMNLSSQDHGSETGFTSKNTGYDVLKGAMGLETRIVEVGKFDWHMALSGTIDYVINVRGDLAFEDLNIFGIGAQISSGFDIGSLVLDLSFQHGIAGLLSADETSRPVVLHFSAGLFF